MFPTSLIDITLSQWIAYTNGMRPVDDVTAQLVALPESAKRGVLITRNYVAKAFKTAEFFGVADLCVDDAIKGYEAVLSLFDSPELPDINPPEITAITFGQFIDAKMITSSDANKWELLRYVTVIFFSEKYNPEDLKEDSVNFDSSGKINMSQAVAILRWFELLNTTINDTYTLFQDSGEKEGDSMKEHMRRWGWINFLKSIAKTKVFDISGSGMNSIDCARAASLDDVLTWASEEKDYNIALSRDLNTEN